MVITFEKLESFFHKLTWFLFFVTLAVIFIQKSFNASLCENICYNQYNTLDFYSSLSSCICYPKYVNSTFNLGNNTTPYIIINNTNMIRNISVDISK